MHDSCLNLTLPFFAHVGLRCNYYGVFSAKTGAIDSRKVKNANSLCTGLYQGPACFSDDALAPLLTANGTALPPARLADVSAGDHILGVGPGGALGPARIIFAHTHAHPGAVVRLEWRSPSGEPQAVELTASHPLPLLPPAAEVDGDGDGGDDGGSIGGGAGLCAAASLPRLLAPAWRARAGDRICVLDASGAGLVPATLTRAAPRPGARLRYVVAASADVLVVGRAAVAAHSSGLGPLEALPFRVAEWLAPGALAWPPAAAALRAVLDSPVLGWAERAIDALFS
jgi:hypothetical protein